MEYVEDDFTDALIDAVCGKLPSTWNFKTSLMKLSVRVNITAIKILKPGSE